MARCGCSSSCSCVVNGTPCVSVTGNGRAADPYVVSAVVDPGVGNLLECGPNGLRAALEIMAVDSDCMDIDIDGNGTLEDPYTITMVPIIATQVQAGGANFLSCTEDGLQVPLSNDAGNTTLMGSDGGIFTPGAVEDVMAGCGISVVDDTISVNVEDEADWPFPCDITEGERIYCAADGTLYLPPPHMFSQGFQADDPSVPVTVLQPGEQVCSPGHSVDIVNPSNCRELAVHLQFGININGEGEPGSRVRIGYEREIDGVPGGSIFLSPLGEATAGSPDFSFDMERDFFEITVPPGGTLPVTARACVINGGTAPLTVNAATATIRWWGGTAGS